MTNQHAVLAISTECRPMGGNRFIELCPPALDLLPERDRREWLGARKEGEQRVGADAFAALSVGIPFRTVEKEPASVIDGKCGAWEKPERTELRPELPLDLGNPVQFARSSRVGGYGWVTDGDDHRRLLSGQDEHGGSFSFDEDAPQDLARSRFRDLVDELKPPDLLVWGHAIGDVRHQLVLCRVSSERHVGLWNFTSLFVRARDDGGIGNCWMGEEHRFQFGRGD